VKKIKNILNKKSGSILFNRGGSLDGKIANRFFLNGNHKVIKK